MIADTTASIASREQEKAALVNDRDIGVAGDDASLRSMPRLLNSRRNSRNWKQNGKPNKSSSARLEACARYWCRQSLTVAPSRKINGLQRPHPPP